MDESQLGGILSRAKGLMAMDETINNIANSTRNETSKGLFESIDEYGGISEENFSSYQPMPEQVMPKTSGAPIRSRLPREIVESMQNNPIDTSILDPNQSILDKVGVSGLPQVKRKNKETRINEQVAQQQPVQSQIDYSLIKSIVEECVRKYTGALSKKIIKESRDNSSELKAMKVGNKFSFITENGDVYEATLKFKKNINEG